MPYLRQIPNHRCPCGKPARVELIEGRNAPMGRYCKGCGARKLREDQQRLKWRRAATRG